MPLAGARAAAITGARRARAQRSNSAPAARSRANGSMARSSKRSPPLIEGTDNGPNFQEVLEALRAKASKATNKAGIAAKSQAEAAQKKIMSLQKQFTKQLGWSRARPDLSPNDQTPGPADTTLLDQLVGMGFAADEAAVALAETGGNDVESAAAFLCEQSCLSVIGNRAGEEMETSGVDTMVSKNDLRRSVSSSPPRGSRNQEEPNIDVSRRRQLVLEAAEHRFTETRAKKGGTMEEWRAQRGLEVRRKVLAEGSESNIPGAGVVPELVGRSSSSSDFMADDFEPVQTSTASSSSDGPVRQFGGSSSSSDDPPMAFTHDTSNTKYCLEAQGLDISDEEMLMQRVLAESLATMHTSDLLEDFREVEAFDMDHTAPVGTVADPACEKTCVIAETALLAVVASPWNLLPSTGTWLLQRTPVLVSRRALVEEEQAGILQLQSQEEPAETDPRVSNMASDIPFVLALSKVEGLFHDDRAGVCSPVRGGA